jgi:zinc protease
MRIWFLSFALLIGCSSIKESGTLSESINIEVEELKLDNGLVALIVRNPKLPIFSIQTFYNVGGKNEVPGITGASHLLEHMMFKGAKKYGKNKIDFIIEGSGGSTNAYTTNDMTVYYENMPSSELEQILDIEADRMENLLLDNEDFNKERDVVLEERKMRYENSPKGQIYIEMMSAMFKGTPYGRSVIGEIQDIKSVSREQMYQYFKRFYAPNNAIIILVGDINISKAKDILKEKFGKISSSPTVEKAHKELKESDFLPKWKESQIVSKKGESPNPLFMLSFTTYKAGHPKGYGLDVLASIIGSGKSASLVKQYVLIEKPIASSIYASHQSLEKSGFFSVGGELIKGINLKEFRNDLVKKLNSFCDTEITSKNIQKVKNNYLSLLYSGLDTNSGLAGFLGEKQVTFGDWRFYKNELDIFDKVSVEEVKGLCHETFSKPSVLVSVWNKNK